MAEPTQFPVSELDHHAARVFVCVSVVLLTVSFATLIARIVFKIQSKLVFALDDCLIIAGFVLAVIHWALLLAVISLCVPPSRSFLTLDEFQQVIKLGVLSVPIWALSIACIKISVACLLLRFQQTKIWRMSLYALIGVIIVTLVGFFIFDLFQCIPLAAAWDPTIQGARCVGSNIFRIVSNTTSGINIATDIILSLFPLTFLRRLRRPLMEKVLVGVLMAMGMTASGASLTKAILIRKWVTAVDTFHVGFTISNWTCIEMFLGVIAACLPIFKPTVQRLLTSLGLEFGFNGPFSFFRSIHGTGAPAEPPQELIDETNKHSENTLKNHTLYSLDVENMSKQTTHVGLETFGSGSDKGREGSNGSQQSGDIV